jgi:hypothetical protein
VRVGLIAALLLVGCAADEPHSPPGPGTPAAVEPGRTLELRADGPDAVALHFTRHPERPSPRMMEIRVTYPSELLAFRGAEPMGAAESADKRLIARDEGGAVRLVVLSTSNLIRLDTGPVARLRFHRIRAGAAELALERRERVFAPIEADVGATLGDPITLEAR